MTIVNNIAGWDEFRKELWIQIGKILDNSKYKPISYTIVGRNFLDTRLVIHFHDCHQVFDFVFNEEDKTMEITKFFTKDMEHEDRMKHSGEFKELTDKWDLIKE